MELDEWNIGMLQQSGIGDVEYTSSHVIVTRELGYNGHEGRAKAVIDRLVFECSDCHVEVDWLEISEDSELCEDHDDNTTGVIMGGVRRGV